MRRLLPLLAVIAVILSLSACRGGDPEDGRSPSVRDPNAGGGQPDGVIKGTVVRKQVVVSSNANLFHNEHLPAPAPDTVAIAEFEGRIEKWLNEHLNDTQGGGEGKLLEVAAPGLLEDAPRPLIEGLSTALASKQRPGLEATYKFTTSHAGVPEWVRADVYVITSEVGDTQTASFIFVPGPDGDPLLIMAEPGPSSTGGGGDDGGDGGSEGGSPRPDASEESER